MTSIMRVLALAIVAALLAVACGQAPEPEAQDTATDAATATDTATATATATDTATATSTATEVAASGCMITDTGGVDDQSFNETSYNGLLRAEEELGVEVQVLESTGPADFEPNMQAFLEQDCTLIVTVGFLLGEVTAAAAEANPDQLFAIVDFDFRSEDGSEDVTFENVRELTFQTDQAAFLAGYVAAAMTESGTVGTYGGIQIPTVTIFMDGFLAGVGYHNQENGTDVQVLGWDGESGLFTGNFESQEDGRALTDQLLQNGADIIMPVAGPVGLGSAAALEEAGEGSLIWVDTDGYESTDFGSLMLTSVMKNMDVAVFDSMQTVVDGSFEGGLYTGTLENQGVQIAPFHDFEDEVPQEVKDALPTLEQGIIDGSISVDPADYGG